ncbi:MAG: YqjK family protein [Burkholderiales bacterium]
MFNDELIEIARRKERLIARAAQQRAAIAAGCLPWCKPLAAADRALVLVRFLKENPLVLGATVAVAALIGRRNLLRWAGRGLFLWRAWRSLKAWSRSFGS